MFDWAKIISGVVQFANFISQWMKERELVNTGKSLQQGEQDAATLENIKKATEARADASTPAVRDALDDELCIDEGNDSPTRH